VVGFPTFERRPEFDDLNRPAVRLPLVENSARCILDKTDATRLSKDQAAMVRERKSLAALLKEA